MSTIDFEIEQYQALTGPELDQVQRNFGVTAVAAINCTGKNGGVIIVAVPNGANVPTNRAGPGAMGVMFVPAANFPWYLDLLRNESPVSCHLNLGWPKGHSLSTGREPVGETELRGAQVGDPPNLENWLNARPNIRYALIWDGIEYESWDDDERHDLAGAFEASWRHQQFRETPDPPENVAIQLPFMNPRQAIRRSDAWRIYIGYAGHCLAAEAGGRLPWSITGWTSDQLRYLFDSGELFLWRPDGFETLIDIHGWAVPCSAGRSWRFLLGNTLVRATPMATIGEVLNWCRDNMRHFSGPVTLDNFEAHWHYRGFPPVSRVMDGTSGPSGFDHHTAGCHGTSGFLKVVLRAANIPVTIEHRPDGMPWDAKHALPNFPSIDRLLTHGDDPYSQLVSSALPLYPCENLLITEGRFNELFGPGVARSTQSQNVGCRPVELALEHLPLYLLRKYCDDMRDGRDHGSGSVFGALSSLGQSVEHLEQAGLWTRLDEKLAALGGCGRLPYP